MTQEHETWLGFAEDDLRMAELALGEKLYNQVCFHAEQCVEKALKALYVSNDRAYPKTHKLADLLTHIGEEKFDDLEERIILLDRFYIPTRYPDALPGSLSDSLPTERDARDALETARDALREVEKRIRRR